jgi:hypothetical protein
MLIFLDKNVSSVSKYSDVITSIKNIANFSKTIIIDGKTMNLSSFFESTDEAYEYNHKAAFGKQYFAKVENGDRILIVIETVGDVFKSSVQSLLKNVAIQKSEDLYDMQKGYYNYH